MLFPVFEHTAAAQTASSFKKRAVDAKRVFAVEKSSRQGD
jgi:hypothetical protein